MASVINNLCASILKVNKTFFFSVPYFSPGLVSIMVKINISSSSLLHLTPLTSSPLTPFPPTLPSPESSSVQFSCSVVSDSLRPHGLQHARRPCPLPTPGAYSNSCPLPWCGSDVPWEWCHPTISTSVISFSSCLQTGKINCVHRHTIEPFLSNSSYIATMQILLLHITLCK